MRYCTFIVTLTLASIALSCLLGWRDPFIKGETKPPPNQNIAEYLFSNGERVQLSLLSLNDLILLPGISDINGEAILNKKKEIDLFGKCSALETVKGIGKFKSQFVCKYIDLKS